MIPTQYQLESGDPPALPGEPVPLVRTGPGGEYAADYTPPIPAAGSNFKLYCLALCFSAAAFLALLSVVPLLAAGFAVGVAVTWSFTGAR